MTAVAGTVGVESCSTSPTCTVNCGSQCGGTQNPYWCAWPHWTRCNSVHCNVQTGLPVPFNNHCGGQIWFRACWAHSVLITAHLLECGPQAATHHAVPGNCSASANANIIACANPALFTSICGGCPTSFGILKTVVFTS
jgi:hypothetical protein